MKQKCSKSLFFPNNHQIYHESRKNQWNIIRCFHFRGRIHHVGLTFVIVFVFSVVTILLSADANAGISVESFIRVAKSM